MTTPARTVLDQAATPISDASLERLVNEVDSSRDIDLDAPSLRRYCETRPRAPGVRRLRALLDPETFRLSDSELERLFRPIAAPVMNVPVNGYGFALCGFVPGGSPSASGPGVRHLRPARGFRG